MARSNSFLNISNVNSTPFCPSSVKPHKTGRPTQTNLAPKILEVEMLDHISSLDIGNVLSSTYFEFLAIYFSEITNPFKKELRRVREYASSV